MSFLHTQRRGITKRVSFNAIKKNITAILMCNIALLCASPDNITELPWHDTFRASGLSEKAMLIPFFMNDTSCFGKEIERGRTMLWNIPAPIARHYGLPMDNTVDLRYDIISVAECAAMYLSDLKKLYNNDTLAILTLMNGAPAVNKKARLLSIDICSTTPEQLALLNDSLPYRIKDISATDIPVLTDSLLLRRVTFQPEFILRETTLCGICNLTLPEFKRLNPALTDNDGWLYPSTTIFIPDNQSYSFTDSCLLKIKRQEKTAFRHYTDSISRQKQEVYAARQNAIKKANAERIYVVKPGDTLSGIACRHKTTVKQLKVWNNLRTDMIRAGQRLKIKQ